MIIILLIGYVILLSIGLFYVLRIRQRDKAQKTYNELLNEITVLEDQTHTECSRINEYHKQVANLEEDIATKTSQLNQLTEGLTSTEQLLRTQLEQERKIWYEEYCQQQQNELQQAALDFLEQFKNDNRIKMQAAKELQLQVEQLRSTAASAIELAKHKMEEENKIDFYRLQLSENAKNDIAALRSIEHLLSNPETINKVIWKSYYEQPYTDLIGRLNLTSITCGIYKITNIENEMTYIGQSVNIAERWKQHIKRGIGAEPPINNKLYPVMKNIGPENFTFEIVEICPKNKLNEREDYWQEFYKAKEFGYSVK